MFFYQILVYHNIFFVATRSDPMAAVMASSNGALRFAGVHLWRPRARPAIHGAQPTHPGDFPKDDSDIIVVWETKTQRYHHKFSIL